MTYRPRPMQLASILPPSNCHHWTTWESTAMTMPGVEAHMIIQSQGGIHVMIDHLTNITLANSEDGLCQDSTLYVPTYKMAGILWPEVYQWSASETELYVESEFTITIPNHQWILIPIPRCQLPYYQATMPIDNRHDGEVVDRAMNIQRGR